jgi:hypothetical protein
MNVISKEIYLFIIKKNNYIVEIHHQFELKKLLLLFFFNNNSKNKYQFVVLISNYITKLDSISY